MVDLDPFWTGDCNLSSSFQAEYNVDCFMKTSETLYENARQTLLKAPSGALKEIWITVRWLEQSLE